MVGVFGRISVGKEVRDNTEGTATHLPIFCRKENGQQEVISIGKDHFSNWRVHHCVPRNAHHFVRSTEYYIVFPSEMSPHGGYGRLPRMPDFVPSYVMEYHIRLNPQNHHYQHGNIELAWLSWRCFRFSVVRWYVRPEGPDCKPAVARRHP